MPAELAPVRPWVEEIFHLLTVASDTLSDEKSRQGYQKTVMQGGGTPEADRKISVVVNTALEFQKVEVLVKRRRYDEAMEIVDRALASVKKEADYPAMKAWILFLRDGLDDPVALEQIRANLRLTFKLNRDHTHGHFVRAHVLKRLGNHDKALAHFKKVVKLDPKNLEALREVRVAVMRHSKGMSTAPPPSSSGRRHSIFAGLFGKKK
jgi:tetratricopeptide (TPR) repeat protein